MWFPPPLKGSYNFPISMNPFLSTVNFCYRVTWSNFFPNFVRNVTKVISIALTLLFKYFLVSCQCSLIQLIVICIGVTTLTVGSKNLQFVPCVNTSTLGELEKTKLVFNVHFLLDLIRAPSSPWSINALLWWLLSMGRAIVMHQNQKFYFKRSFCKLS